MRGIVKPVIEPRPNGGDVIVVILLLLIFDFILAGFYLWAAEVFAIGSDSVLWSALLLTSVIEIEAVLLGGVWFRGIPVRAIGLRPPEPDWIARNRRALLMIFIVWVSALALVFSDFKSDRLPLSLFPIVLMMLDACTFGPLAEELIFRGLLFTWLRRKRGSTYSNVTTSALFATSHYVGDPLSDIDPAIFLSKFLFVWCCALAYERSGSLWPAVVLHSTTNGVISSAKLIY